MSRARRKRDDSGPTHREIADHWHAHGCGEWAGGKPPCSYESGLGFDWADVLAELKRGRGLCWRCAEVRKLEKCHIVPASRGGANSPGNLVLLCQQCHRDAPDVVDPAAMWVWLRAMGVPLYGTFWMTEALLVFRQIHGRWPDLLGLVPGCYYFRLRSHVTPDGAEAYGTGKPWRSEDYIESRELVGRDELSSLAGGIIYHTRDFAPWQEMKETAIRHWGESGLSSATLAHLLHDLETFVRAHRRRRDAA